MSICWFRNKIKPKNSFIALIKYQEKKWQRRADKDTTQAWFPLDWMFRSQRPFPVIWLACKKATLLKSRKPFNFTRNRACEQRNISAWRIFCLVESRLQCCCGARIVSSGTLDENRILFSGESSRLMLRFWGILGGLSNIPFCIQRKPMTELQNPLSNS